MHSHDGKYEKMHKVHFIVLDFFQMRRIEELQISRMQQSHRLQSSKPKDRVFEVFEYYINRNICYMSTFKKEINVYLLFIVY